jgi:hypothetical protein
MTAIIYRDINYQGVYATLGAGLYSGRDLVGCPHRSTSCEDLDNAINSVRIDPNTIVAVADGHSITATGGGARVIIGPADISDLAAIGMGNRISSVLVAAFRNYDSAAPVPDGGAVISSAYSMSGPQSRLRRGDYTPARLTSEEVKLAGPNIVSVSAAAGVIVVLYSGSNFETTTDAVMVIGPTVVDDVDTLGMGGRVRSMRVLYSDVIAGVAAAPVPATTGLPTSMQPSAVVADFNAARRRRMGAGSGDGPVTGPPAAEPAEPAAAPAAIAPTWWFILWFIVCIVAAAVTAAAVAAAADQKRMRTTGGSADTEPTINDAAAV